MLWILGLFFTYLVRFCPRKAQRAPDIGHRTQARRHNQYDTRLVIYLARHQGPPVAGLPIIYDRTVNVLSLTQQFGRYIEAGNIVQPASARQTRYLVHIFILLYVCSMIPNWYVPGTRYTLCMLSADNDTHQIHTRHPGERSYGTWILLLEILRFVVLGSNGSSRVKKVL